MTLPPMSRKPGCAVKKIDRRSKTFYDIVLWTSGRPYELPTPNNDFFTVQGLYGLQAKTHKSARNKGMKPDIGRAWKHKRCDRSFTWLPRDETIANHHARHPGKRSLRGSNGSGSPAT